MFIHDIIKIEYIRQGYLPDFPYHLTSDEEMFNAFIVDEIRITEDVASKVKEGEHSLWESPKTYINQYKLASFEFVQEGSSQILVIKGSSTRLAVFNSLTGLDCESALSPDCYFGANYPLMYDSLKSQYDELVSAIYYHIEAHIDSKQDVVPLAVPNWVYSYMIGAVIGPNSSQADIHDMLALINLDNLGGEFTQEVCNTCLDISTKWVKKLPPNKNEMRPPTIYGEPHVIKSLRITGIPTS